MASDLLFRKLCHFRSGYEICHLCVGGGGADRDVTRPFIPQTPLIKSSLASTILVLTSYLSNDLGNTTPLADNVANSGRRLDLSRGNGTKNNLERFL